MRSPLFTSTFIFRPRRAGKHTFDDRSLRVRLLRNFDVLHALQSRWLGVTSIRVPKSYIDSEVVSCILPLELKNVGAARGS